MKKALILALLALPVFGARTHIVDSLHRADGSTCSGNLSISWPTFTSTSSQLIYAGSISSRIIAGVVDVSLEPGSYVVGYQVAPPGCTPSTEYWAVPTSSSVLAIADVRTLYPPIPPAQVALSSLSKSGAISGQCPVWNGSNWVPATCPGSSSSNWLTITNAPFLDIRRYDFTAQTPGGPLTASVAATKTLTPCPDGVAGADTNHYLYLSGGTGTAEAVLITGGTCTSGASTGTLTFTPANNHTGAWAVSSATGGLQEALNYGSTGASIFCPGATRTMHAQATVAFANVTIWGGDDCIFQAVANAHIKNMLVGATSATGLQILGTVWDGNRDNGGSSEGGNDPTFALLRIHGSTIKLTAEVENGAAVGINIEGIGTAPNNIEISSAYIHHNGGVIDGNGIGVGLRLGGTPVPTNVRIIGNHFDSNYNKAVSIHYSNGINSVGATNVTVTGNTFLNNLSTAGGQIYAAGTAGCTTEDVKWAITGNTFEQTTTFLGDTTAGVELCAKGIVVTGNSISGSTFAGIVLDGSVQNALITGNRITTTTGIGILVGGSSGNTISDNIITAPHGIEWYDYTTTNAIYVFQNNLSGSASPFFGTPPGPTSFVYLMNNPGYNPTGGTGAVSITASPFSYQAGIVPEVVYIIGGTITTVIKNGSGNPVCTSSPCTVTMFPAETLVLTYSSGAGMVMYANKM